MATAKDLRKRAEIKERAERDVEEAFETVRAQLRKAARPYESGGGKLVGKETDEQVF